MKIFSLGFTGESFCNAYCRINPLVYIRAASKKVIKAGDANRKVFQEFSSEGEKI